MPRERGYFFGDGHHHCFPINRSTREDRCWVKLRLTIGASLTPPFFNLCGSASHLIHLVDWLDKSGITAKKVKVIFPMFTTITL